MKNRVEELARAIRASKIWDMNQLAELSSLAGMDQEWADADGETFETIAFAAADKLGVELIDKKKQRRGVER
ncbi:MAG: hypothetical protein KGZ53_09255 [Peptococcaceae bacterium]|nr:hypothetical protein [Peptococcaceae bacterium]